jgi:predicted transcriptional regulator
MATMMNDRMLFQMQTDRLVLEDLSENGRNLAANVADNVDLHRKTVSPRLRQLDDYGLVRDIGRGVYEITDEGELALEVMESNPELSGDELGDLVEQEIEGTED